MDKKNTKEIYRQKDEWERERVMGKTTTGERKINTKNKSKREN